MDVRTLECFIAVARELHFRRAAAQLNLSQPALSQRIRSLEQIVGVPLFERNQRNVALTPAGKEFLAPAEATVASANVAMARARRAMRGELGRLRLGYTTIAIHSRLPEAIRQFKARYPDVTLEVVERNSPSLEAALATDDIDLAILHPPLDTPMIATLSLPDLRIVAAIPAGHPLAQRDVVAIADLDNEPLIGPSLASAPHISQRMLERFRAAGVVPNITQRVSPMTSLICLVAADLGIGFVTEGVAVARRPDVVYRALRPEPPGLPIAVGWLEPRLIETGQRFLEIIRDTMAIEGGGRRGTR